MIDFRQRAACFEWYYLKLLRQQWTLCLVLTVPGDQRLKQVVFSSLSSRERTNLRFLKCERSNWLQLLVHNFCKTANSTGFYGTYCILTVWLYRHRWKDQTFREVLSLQSSTRWRFRARMSCGIGEFLTYVCTGLYTILMNVKWYRNSTGWH